MKLKQIIKLRFSNDPDVRRVSKDVFWVHVWALVYVYLTNSKSEYAFRKYKQHMDRCLDFAGAAGHNIYNYVNWSYYGEPIDTNNENINREEDGHEWR